MSIAMWVYLMFFKGEGMSKELRRALDELQKKPCQCVYCQHCAGTGNIRVSYDALGRMREAYGDDMDDLEQCDQCHGGITEECQRCTEMQELYELLEEEEYRESRRP